MAGRLLIAAGGGGDVITAVLLGRQLDPSSVPVVMSFAWERLVVDPLPGPRSAADFRGLRRLAGELFELLPSSEAIPPGLSLLPRLAHSLGARVLLLDPSGGARGLSRQITVALGEFGLDGVILVDVGGDIVARGDEAGLSSPLADGAALAAAVLADPLAEVAVIGPGLDGELPRQLVVERVTDLGFEHLDAVAAMDFHAIAGIFEWHPSEVSGLLARAAQGAAGTVEIRDHGLVVRIGPESVAGFVGSAARLLRDDHFAARLEETESLHDVEQVVRRACGRSEIDYERAKVLAGSSRPRPAVVADLMAVDEIAEDVRSRGIDFVTTRRLAEAVGTAHFDLNRLLARHRPDALLLPIFAVDPTMWIPASELPGSRDGRGP